MSLFVFFISLLIVAQHVSGNHVPIIRSWRLRNVIALCWYVPWEREGGQVRLAGSASDILLFHRHHLWFRSPVAQKSGLMFLGYRLCTKFLPSSPSSCHVHMLTALLMAQTRKSMETCAEIQTAVSSHWTSYCNSPRQFHVRSKLYWPSKPRLH